MTGLFGDDIKEVTFQDGDFLFHEGEKSFHFYILHEGEVEIFRTKDDKKLPLAIIETGHSIGEFAMIDRLPRSASAQAIGTVRTTCVSEHAYQQLLSELPEWAVSVMKGLVERLRQTNDIIRRHGIVDDKVKRQAESVEYNSTITVLDEAPFLNRDEN